MEGLPELTCGRRRSSLDARRITLNGEKSCAQTAAHLPRASQRKIILRDPNNTAPNTDTKRPHIISAKGQEDMRTRAKFVRTLAEFSLKNVKRLEVKFDPFHANAGAVREFYQGATFKKALRTNPECITKVEVVCDQSDPLVKVQFVDNHKLVLNSKHLEPNHIIALIKQFETLHKDEPEDV